MYVLIVYDIGVKRVVKALKFLRTYLNWVQNSVFEGNVSESQLLKIKNGLLQIIDSNSDSVIIYTSREQKWLSKSILGKEKNPVDNFL
ncbi:MAG TPA: CRISPR-associated endonuclease Cas2 [Clostridiales bacterium]|nr:CRISPR-associated endonuclease Cas2 [Clostridiales bacterium]